MDINIIEEKLEKEYQCQFVAVINYADKDFVKAFDLEEKRVFYRYFRVLNDNNLEEIVEELLLAYFRKMNEIQDETNY